MCQNFARSSRLNPIAEIAPQRPQSTQRRPRHSLAKCGDVPLDHWKDSEHPCDSVLMRSCEPLRTSRALVRQVKPGRSCDLKGGHHVNCPLTCSPASMRRSNPAGEASRGEGVSRSASEPDSASLRSARVARLPKRLKPAPATKQRADAVAGLSGVGGDGARRQIGRGTWETRPSGGSTPNARR